MNASTTRSGVHRLMVTTILGLLSLGFCIAVQAGPGDESRTVRFSDLDLSKPSDAHVLYRRLRAAAEVACSHYFFTTDTDKSGCVRGATADAVTRINEPALTAVYEANNRIPVTRGLVSQSR